MRRTLWRHSGRALLAVVGLSLVAYLAREAGPARIARVLWQGGSWLPIIFALELAQLGSDFIALRLLFRSQSARIPRGSWLRSSAIAYAMMILVPAGRAAGEVARATLLARHVGAPRAATASAQLQSSYLLANGLASAAACAVVASWLGFRSPLAVLLGANVLVMATFASFLLAILWDARIGRWLDRLRRRFTGQSAERPLETAARRGVTWGAVAVCSVSRCAQVIQYGAILSAVGGVPSVRGVFGAYGIHLIGATVGDMLPNQLGVVDGAYRTFARTIGFGDAPARALSIAFIAHAVQLIVAGACVVVATVTRREASHEESAPSSVRAEAHW